MDNLLDTISLEHIEIRDVQDESALIPWLSKYMYIIHKINQSATNSELDKALIPFFRGQSIEAWNVIPSVFRNGYLNSEHDLIRNAIRKSPTELAKDLTNFERLTKLQHYGIPTRLLDVTENPLVALYFACEHEPNHDAAVYITHTYPYYPESKAVQILSLIAHLDVNGLSFQELWHKMEQENINYPLPLAEAVPSSFSNFISLVNRNYFVLPNLNNSRIKHQQGAFLLCGCIKTTLQDNIWDSILEKTQENLSGEFTHKIIIPSTLKQEILHELDQYNFNEASMYPELDHQMKYIANKLLLPQSLFQRTGEHCELDFIAPDIAEISHKVPNKSPKPKAEVPAELHNIISNYIYDVSTADSVYNIFVENANIDWSIRKQLQANISRNIARYLHECGYRQTIDECSAIAKSIVDEAVGVSTLPCL